MTFADLPDNHPFQNGPDGWPLLRAMLEQLRIFYGTPACVMLGRMREGALRSVRNLATKLRVMIALTRRLILIEAATLTPPERKSRTPRGPRKRNITPEGLIAEPGVTFFKYAPHPTEDSSTWRAALQLFPNTSKHTSPPISPHQFRPQNPFRMLRKLALRYEALRRIAADPRKYALRYAQLRPKRPPPWLLEPFPGRAVDRANAHYVYPAHAIALKAALNNSS